MSRLVLLTRRRSVWLLFIGILCILVFAPQSVVAATCSTSGPSSGTYTVTLCFTAPVAGATLSGNNSVTISISVSGTNPGVQRAIYNMDSTYLITSFASPYAFTLPTANYVDGSHTLSVQLFMRDGFTTGITSESVTFTNGVSSPPTNNATFTPATGTTPAAGQPFTVVAVGDGAGGESNETKVVNLISSWNPNLMLYLGDVYQEGSPVEFYNWYNPTGFYGVFRAITDPTIGNHEYLTGSPTGYFSYWNNIPNYYSFNAGGWHFISLNSNSQFIPTSTSSPQYQWLQQDLTANAGTCTIVFYHEPLYNVGPEGDATTIRAIWSLLYSYHIPLVVNGHDHDYQRWVPLDGSGNPASDGITEIIAGGGGHGIQTFATTDKRLAVGYDNSSTFGALRIRLGSSSASFAYINTAGSTLDSGTIPCQAGTGTNNTPTPTPTSTSTLASTPTNTPAATPTATNTPTLAATPTNTPTRTPTTAVTPTNTPTRTPTLAATPTLLPATATPTPLLLTPTPTATGSQITTTFNPVADAYVNSGSPSSNYGTSTTLRVDGSPIMNSYLRFSVAGLTGTVKKVTLQVYANSSLSTGITASRVADNTWGETTITYSNAPAIGTAINTSTAVTSGTWISIDVTAYVIGNGTYSLVLTSTNGTALSMGSRESANPPRLIITTQ